MPYKDPARQRQASRDSNRRRRAAKLGLERWPQRVCLDCSASIDHRNSNTKRCEPCQKVRGNESSARRRAKRRHSRPMRTCLDCSVSIDHRHGLAKRCEPCLKVWQNESSARYYAANREEIIKRYRTNRKQRVCPDCSVSIDHRGNSAKRCAPCAAVHTKVRARVCNLRYRAAHPERVAKNSRATAARYRAAHPERVEIAKLTRKKWSQWSPEARERATEKSARWAAAHPEQRAKSIERHYAPDRERRAAKRALRVCGATGCSVSIAQLAPHAQFCKPCAKQRAGADWRRRRAAKLNQLGTVTRSKSDILAEQGGICVAPGCGVSIGLNDSHLDHHISLRWGGLEDDSNIQVLCIPCNLSKSDKDPHVFARERGFLRWENGPNQPTNTSPH